MDHSINESGTWPESSPGTRRRLRGLPLGSLGMLALIWVVECFVWGRSLDYLDMTSMSWRLSGAAARREARDCEVLCFGDSMSKMAVIPGVIKRFSGKTAYNLSVNAARPAVSY